MPSTIPNRSQKWLDYLASQFLIALSPPLQTLIAVSHVSLLLSMMPCIVLESRLSLRIDGKDCYCFGKIDIGSSYWHYGVPIDKVFFCCRLLYLITFGKAIHRRISRSCGTESDIESSRRLFRLGLLPSFLFSLRVRVGDCPQIRACSRKSCTSAERTGFRASA